MKKYYISFYIKHPNVELRYSYEIIEADSKKQAITNFYYNHQYEDESYIIFFIEEMS